MVEVDFYSHPLAEPQQYSVGELAPWLLGAVPEGFAGAVYIYQGSPAEDARITEPADIIRARGHITVICEPGAAALTWAAMSKILVAVAISTALSFVIGALTRPDVNNSRQNRTQASPNNALGERDNQVRVLERVEDIYGQVLSVPSLMMPPYRKYISHQQVEYGYYCVGRGYYALSEIKDGDTPLSDFLNASASVYDPFTSPNGGAPVQQIGPPISDPIQTVKRSVQVDGAVLKALNQKQIVGAQGFDFEAPHTMRQREGTHPNFSEIAEAGQTATVSVEPGTASVFEIGTTASNPRTLTSPSVSKMMVGSQISIRLSIESAVPGSFIVQSREGNTATLSFVSGQDITEYTGEVSVTYPLPAFSFTGVISAVGDRTLVFESQTFESSADRKATVSINTGEDDAWTAWFSVTDPTAAQVWVNVVAPGGMYKDRGDGELSTTVAFELQVQALSGGAVYAVSSSLSGATTTERADTIEYALPFTGSFRVRMRRTTPYDYDFEGTVVDEIKWTDLYSVSPVYRTDFGNKTTIHTVTRATARATASRQRQLNCKAFRRIPTYNGMSWSGVMASDGRVQSGTIHPTARAIDVMAAMLQDPKVGARPLSDMDVAQVWQTQMALEAWNPVCGEFNYTFDTTESSLEDMLGTVAGAVFSMAYRQSGRIRLFFERSQSQASALFSHRNKRADAETMTRSFSNANDYDGVEIGYRDRESTQSEVIRIPLDGSALRYKKVELHGVTHFAAAWFKAAREYNKLFNQRVVIETDVTGDGRLVTPGAMVQIVDNTRMRSYDGEVLAQEGLALTLSQPIELGISPTIMLKRRDGSTQTIPVSPGASSRQVTLAYAPSEQVVTSVTPNGGLRTEFSIASNDRRLAQAYLVQEVSRSDGEYVTLTAVNYSDAYYSADSQPVPDRNAVINGV